MKIPDLIQDGGRWRARTSDLLRVKQALLPSELIAPAIESKRVARLAGLEPATSGSASQCSIQLSYKRLMPATNRDNSIIPGAEGEI